MNMVSKFLADLGLTESQDSEGQLQAAKSRPRSFTEAQESQARRQGFRSAEEAYLWQKRKEDAQGSSAGGRVKQAARRGVETINVAHPKGILERVTEVLNRANGGN